MAADLIALVADGNMLAAVRGLMQRRASLHISGTFSFEIRPHPERDPGCRVRSHDFLRPFQNQYRFALVMFDREGCGSQSSRVSLETECESQLANSGWKDRSAAVVIDPELENWVWTDSPHVSDLLGWINPSTGLRDWLFNSGYLRPDQHKPNNPKDVMEQVLRKVRKPRSSSIYESLARKVGLSACRDPAFAKFRQTLQTWFPL